MGLRASLLKGGFSPYLALLLIVCLAASRVSSQESATETNDSNGLIKDLDFVDKNDAINEKTNLKFVVLDLDLDARLGVFDAFFASFSMIIVSEAVASLCWQRSKPVIVNESNCTTDTALLGGAAEDSILMPDPLPSVPSSSLSTSTTGSGSLNPGRSSPYAESFSFASGSTGSLSSSLSLPTGEETPIRSSLISQISTIP